MLVVARAASKARASRRVVLVAACAFAAVVVALCQAPLARVAPRAVRGHGRAAAAGRPRRAGADPSQGTAARPPPRLPAADSPRGRAAADSSRPAADDSARPRLAADAAQRAGKDPPHAHASAVLPVPESAGPQPRGAAARAPSGQTAGEGPPAKAAAALLPYPRASTADVAPGDAPPPPQAAAASSSRAGGKCARYIVYDKPVKTGSTAITLALQELLVRAGETWARCGDKWGCRERARAICAGGPRRHLLLHMAGEPGLVECLRARGYYAVTSVRAPRARWESAFLYNRAARARHYGIDHRANYTEFMARMPACALYAYYDGGSGRCRGEPVGARAAAIAARYDEVLDLYDGGARGPLATQVRALLREKNRSPRAAGALAGAAARSRLANETVLYDALRARRADVLRRPRARLCARERAEAPRAA